MEGDLIFVNIDPVFNIALHTLKELNDQGRLEVTNVQRACLNGIRSDADLEDNQFRFGGENGNATNRARAFGRTASAVFRMVMLRAVQINEDVWPQLGANSMGRNKDAAQFEQLFGDLFRLVTENDPNQHREQALRYWSNYDRAFPHFHIEREVFENQGAMVNFNNMMLIFRNNVSEVIEITTNANAKMSREENGEFDSYVNVLCIRRRIKMQGFHDVEGGHFKKFKEYTKQKFETNPKYKKDVLDMLKPDSRHGADFHKKFNEILFISKHGTETERPVA